MRSALIGEHIAGRMADDAGRGASHHEPLETRLAASAHDDHRHLVLGGFVCKRKISLTIMKISAHKIQKGKINHPAFFSPSKNYPGILTTYTEHGACLTTFAATLPILNFVDGSRPRLPIIIRSIFSLVAKSIIASGTE